MDKHPQAFCYYLFNADSLLESVGIVRFEVMEGDLGFQGKDFIFPWARLLVYLSSVYVLVEAYTIEGIKIQPFPRLDALLSDKEKVDSLRLLRNGTFHYQSEPYHEKILQFIRDPANQEWTKKVHEEFRSYCLHLFPNHPSILTAKLTISAIKEWALSSGHHAP